MDVVLQKQRLLCLVCGNGADDNIHAYAVVKLDKAVLRRAGPLLCGMVEDCVPDEKGMYIVRVPEMRHPREVMPLVRYLRGDKDFGSRSNNIWRDDHLVEVYKSYMLATGRLDVPGFARAVETQLLDALKGGAVSAPVGEDGVEGSPIDTVARNFRGCPRVEALCDHYVSMVGRVPPEVPPLHNVAELAGYDMSDPRGIVLVFGEDEFWLIANVELCRDLSAKSDVCRHVAQDVPVRRRSQSSSEHEEGKEEEEEEEEEEEWNDEWEDYVIYTMGEYATIRNYPDLEPSWTLSWLTTTRGLKVSEVMTDDEVNSFFEGTTVQLIVLPEGSKGVVEYSRDMLSDFLFKYGAGRRFGGHPHEYE